MNAHPVVRTAAGRVRGQWEDAVAVFRGVRYAEPPVGNLRFMAPVPVRRREGVRDALRFGPSVPQRGHPGLVMTTADPAAVIDGSDDCLTLNVWTLEPGGGVGLPVMVFIEGGTYLENHSANPHYDAALLAQCGVVVVTINYRVGADGFARISGAPNNRGLLDQIAALRWVQDNAAVFGGDPANLTVFGQSAGAACIAALLVAPAAAGLFTRAICQSMPGTFFTEQLAAAVSDAITAQLGVRADVDDLAGIPPYALVEATTFVLDSLPTKAEVWGPMALTPTPFSPVVDGDVLPYAPWRGLAAGSARDISVLIGHTRDEYRLFVTDATAHDLARNSETLSRVLGGDIGNQRYRDAYPHATEAQRCELLFSDWLFRMPSVHLADAAHAGGARVWFYELDWSYNADEGASHSLDVLLLFGTLRADEVRAHRHAYPNAAHELESVGDHMRSDWALFAATGSPGWPAYHPSTRTTRVYRAAPRTEPYPEERSRQMWTTHRFDALGPTAPPRA